jgi:hypothetical protein
MAAKFLPHLQKISPQAQNIQIFYSITPRVPTSVYMYWVPIIHRLYIPQLNILITR